MAIFAEIAYRTIALSTQYTGTATRLNDLSYGIKIWTDFSSVLSQSTRLTDGRTDFSSQDRVCIPCGAVKTSQNNGKFIYWQRVLCQLNG